MRRTFLTAVILAAALAGCGGGSPSAPPPRAPVIGGLVHSVDAARAVVTQSQQDAQRAASTSAGP